MTRSLTTTAGRSDTATTGVDATSTPATDAYPLSGGAEVIRACGAEPPAGSDPILIAVSVLARKHLECIQAVPAQRDLYDNVARRFTDDPDSGTLIARAVWADLVDGHLGPPPRRHRAAARCAVGRPVRHVNRTSPRAPGSLWMEHELDYEGRCRTSRPRRRLRHWNVPRLPCRAVTDARIALNDTAGP
ncbi:hypothetical protein ACRAKI_22205 [Saccharothrix isguenensis]